MNQTEYIFIAALNQYAYCPHRCWRMFCAGQFTDNQYTIEGTTLHDRVHTTSDVQRGETWQIRAIWLKSEQYKLIGKSDLIEAESGQVYPVEYKRGRKSERPLIVDAVVLSLINKRSLTLTDFTTEPLSGAVSLTKEGLHTFLRAYEQKKQSEFKHPVMGNKCTYQKSFEIQARLLSKYLMNEIDKYPPLVLK
ncbi:CRISPR-associated protein Cas4 [Nostoc sp. XA013]|nr:CRISPR-associated protein Cas4 [Nostoc sp. XA013]